jgi:glycerol-3-phosphate cytidylyltransferase
MGEKASIPRICAMDWRISWCASADAKENPSRFAIQVEAIFAWLIEIKQRVQGQFAAPDEPVMRTPWSTDRTRFCYTPNITKNTMKRVLTYGTFDLFHIGHIRLLARAKALGDHLAVGLSTDDFNHIKGKKSVFSYQERFMILSSIRYVDTVFPESSWDQKLSDIREHKIDLFVIGNDWAGKFDFLKVHCEVLYLPRTEGISSTYLKNLLAEG